MTDTATATMNCPFCAEQVAVGAKKCRHCGEFIDPTLRDMEALKNQKQNVFMNAGGGSSSSSAAASSASSGDGRRRRGFTLIDLFLVFFTGGLWLIRVFTRD